MKTDKNTDNQNTKRRSTFAILFYINRKKVLTLHPLLKKLTS